MHERAFYGKVVVLLVVVVDCFYTVLTAIQQIHCACMGF